MNESEECNRRVLFKKACASTTPTRHDGASPFSAKYKLVSTQGKRSPGSSKLETKQVNRSDHEKGESRSGQEGHPHLF